MATTLVTGASLAPSFTRAQALALIGTGSVAGAALVAALAPVGPRLGVPSVIAARAALGRRGASLLALLLYLTNFAWIALNNVIAAAACARVVPGSSERAWAMVLGLLATAVVALGPRAVGWADRVAVPLMALVGGLMLVRCLALPADPAPLAERAGSWLGFDVVVGYQVSWILMFADYSRYTRSGPRSAAAVFLALALSSIWFMSVGLLAAQAAGGGDPGRMMVHLGLGVSGAALLALATLTTNFVNIYLSALAWRSVFPRSSDRVSVWSIGIVGAGLSLFSRAWLERYADFMLLLGGLLVPVGGVLLSRLMLVRSHIDPDALYDAGGPYRGFDRAGALAWLAGALTYSVAAGAGATLPALAVSVGCDLVLRRLGFGQSAGA